MASPVRMFWIFVLAFVGFVASHPGHDHKVEAEIRSKYLQSRPRSLADCADTLRSRGHEEATLGRRHALAEHLGRKRPAGNPQHLDDVDLTTRSTAFLPLPKSFFNDNTSCILQPDSTEGPYYVKGEFIRSNITNEEAGIPMVFDVQVIDTSTCTPAPEIYLDFWHCNATGVYSGVVAISNGDSRDMDNLKNTALRGAQRTNLDGVVQFETIFPGHYAGRTNHVHVLTHFQPEIQSHNGMTENDKTISGLVATHIGQLYFDQTLINTIEAVKPYSQNSQPRTQNDRDGFLAAETRSYDPIVRHLMLGNDVRDGVLAWISIGVDLSERHNVHAGQVLNIAE